MSTEEEKLLIEAKKLSWEDRLAHKNWKVRNEGYVDLAAFCESVRDPKDQRLRDIGPLFKKAVSDSNAPAQEKALDALIAFQLAADADANRFAKEVCEAMVAKCLTGRTKTVEKAVAGFLLWVELEAVEAFMDAMDKAVKNKVAKAVVPAIDAVYQALSQFGGKVVPPKRILKLLPELFNHADQNVRAAAKGLTVELCKWIGKENVTRLLFEGIRDATKAELEAELNKVEGRAVPTRKIRSEQDKVEEVAVEEAVPDEAPAAVEEEPAEADAYEFCDPVDILTPLSKGPFWEGVNFSAGAKFMLPVLLGHGRGTVWGVLLPVAISGMPPEKLKEKKANVVAAIRDALQACFKGDALTFPDILE
eukprot:jgi/Mesen1/444/ME000101S10673